VLIASSALGGNIYVYPFLEGALNILYTITWPESDSEDSPRKFYEQLRSSVASGARFPYDCPYEIALVRASSTPDATPPHAVWAVAILANSVTGSSMGALDQTVPELERWFSKYIPGGRTSGSVIHTAEASHLKLASELRPDYDVVENFGTFVGEPEVEPFTETVEAKPMLVSEMEALKTLAGQPLSQEAPKILTNPPTHPVAPPLKSVTTQPASSNTVSSCLGLGLMISGVILIPISLVLGALMAIGQFYSDPSPTNTTTTSIGEFLLYLACCPVPVLVLGIGMIFLGVYIPRWLKQNQSPPVILPKG